MISNIFITENMKPGTSPVTPYLKLSGAGHQDFPVFQSLQLLGCEALAHFLGSTEAGEAQHKFRLGNFIFIYLLINWLID